MSTLKRRQPVVEQLAAHAHDVDALKELLTGVYPSARVSVGDSLGALPGEPTRVYVYRDGNGLEGTS